jgi:hypothetical protein
VLYLQHGAVSISAGLYQRSRCKRDSTMMASPGCSTTFERASLQNARLSGCTSTNTMLNPLEALSFPMSIDSVQDWSRGYSKATRATRVYCNKIVRVPASCGQHLVTMCSSKAASILCKLSSSLMECPQLAIDKANFRPTVSRLALACGSTCACVGPVSIEQHRNPICHDAAR